MVDVERRYPTHEAFDSGCQAVVLRDEIIEVVVTETPGGLQLEARAREGQEGIEVLVHTETDGAVERIQLTSRVAS